MGGRKDAFKEAIDIIHEEAKAYNESVKGDLISRSALIKTLQNKQPHLDLLASMIVSEVIEIIKEQPTACNVGTLVEHNGCVGCKYEHFHSTSSQCQGGKQNVVDKTIE